MADPDSRSEFNLVTTHLIHPDDEARYLQALKDVAQGRQTTAQEIFRLLTIDNGWLPVEIVNVPLPRALPRFRAVLIRPVANTTSAL